MTHLHTAAVQKWLMRPHGILDRRAPPRRLRDEAAQAAEVEMMTRAIANAIPANVSTDRLPAAFASAEYTIDLSGLTIWPTVKELLDAIRPHMPRPSRSEEGPGLDDAAIDAARIKAGEPVAESSLFGERAMAMIRRGLVTEADLEPYRRSAFVERARKNDHAAAQAWHEEAQHRHRLAQAGDRASIRFLPEVRVRQMPQVSDA